MDNQAKFAKESVNCERGSLAKATWMVVCAALLWGGTAYAKPTAQEGCEYARLTAGKVYQSCVAGVVGKSAAGVSLDVFAAFAKCRHTYFQKWAGFQRNATLVGSTCIGNRLTDNGDGTVTDHLTGLVWEQRTNYDGMPNVSNPHDADNIYPWSLTSGSRIAETGSAFTSFLSFLNSGGGFAGSSGWRLPTLTELQTIQLDFPCSGSGGGRKCKCPSSPCIDAAFGPTQSNYYWSVTTYIPNPQLAWIVSFSNANVSLSGKTENSHVRAVRGNM